VFRQLAEACGEVGAVLCGGHTEVTHGLPRPIVVGHMLGEVAADRVVTSAGARVGDLVILTKHLAVEGTALMAIERRRELRSVLSDADLDRCAALLHDPGISVVRDAQLALETGGVHALHDLTEGGLATGLWELCQAAGVGVVVERDRLPVLDRCATLCRHFALDPLGLLASGSLLIAAAPEHGPAVEERLGAAGIAATTIGQLVPADQGCILRGADDRPEPLPTFARDEIARLFD
jgi:hydrogenase maturation factor